MNGDKIEPSYARGIWDTRSFRNEEIKISSRTGDGNVDRSTCELVLYTNLLRHAQDSDRFLGLAERTRRRHTIFDMSRKIFGFEPKRRNIEPAEEETGDFEARTFPRGASAICYLIALTNTGCTKIVSQRREIPFARKFVCGGDSRCGNLIGSLIIRIFKEETLGAPLFGS